MMKEKLTTKKFPVALGKDDNPTTRSEFVIPPIYGNEMDTFIGLKSGRRREKGCISYIGVEITVSHIIEKLKESPFDLAKAQKILEDFLKQLQKFKIGNIISIKHKTDGSFSLEKEADYPPRKQERKLP